MEIMIVHEIQDAFDLNNAQMLVIWAEYKKMNTAFEAEAAVITSASNAVEYLLQLTVIDRELEEEVQEAWYRNLYEQQRILTRCYEEVSTDQACRADRLWLWAMQFEEDNLLEELTKKCNAVGLVVPTALTAQRENGQPRYRLEDGSDWTPAFTGYHYCRAAAVGIKL